MTKKACPPRQMWHRLAPNHEVLHYDNYLHANISEERVVFDRCFDPEWYCGFERPDRPGQLVGPWMERQNPGALVELRTNAARVRVTLRLCGNLRRGLRDQ